MNQPRKANKAVEVLRLILHSAIYAAVEVLEKIKKRIFSIDQIARFLPSQLKFKRLFLKSCDEGLSKVSCT